MAEPFQIAILGIHGHSGGYVVGPVTLGIDPIHFGIILIANLCTGLLTPPVGTCLFVGAGVGHSDIMRVSRAMMPFYVVMVLALLLITFWAPLSLFLPGLFP